MTTEEMLRSRAVKVESIEDFLNKYYKFERYRGRGPEYADVLLTSYKKRVKEDGCCFISRHDSTTGEIVSYYPEPDKKQMELEV